jgi:menaquinone-dependent protoporphyrinogen IX oxidase
MQRQRITCPETAHLEEIDLERTSAGIVIAGCSYFEPRCAVECTRECARRMDLRDRRDSDDRNERVLVLAPTRDARTESLARQIAAALICDGFSVELADAGSRTAPPPADYKAAVIGSPIASGRYARPVIDYVTSHRDALARMPTFFFVSGNPRRPDAGDDPGGHIARVFRTTGWRPSRTTCFAKARLASWVADQVRIAELAAIVADEVE